jgi:tetratricopeptide (TPR) repeat protein
MQIECLRSAGIQFVRANCGKAYFSALQRSRYLSRREAKFHEASTSARKAYRLSLYEPIKKTVMAYVHAMFDEVDRATQELNELNETRRTRDAYVSPFHMALIYVALNKLDQAFECFEEAFKDRDQWLVFLKVEPRLDALRSYPQFQDLLLRLNFD